MARVAAQRLVLASQSPFRCRLLKAAGLKFRVVAAHLDEAAIKERACAARATPYRIAAVLARSKAEAVSSRFPGEMVIGADQVLACGRELFNKPTSAQEARKQLLFLRGRVHCLFTAAALAIDGRAVWEHTETGKLHVRHFSEAFLAGYLAAAGPRAYQTVGAYAIEEQGIQLFERIEGDYFAIIGLPLLALLAELRRRGALTP